MLVFLSVCAGADARKVSGKVHCDGKALSGVVVTDGTVFTKTKGDGTFSINAGSLVILTFFSVLVVTRVARVGIEAYSVGFQDVRDVVLDLTVVVLDDSVDMQVYVFVSVLLKLAVEREIVSVLHQYAFIVARHHDNLLHHPIEHSMHSSTLRHGYCDGVI